MEIGATTKVDVTRYYYQNGMVAYATNESGNLKNFNYYGVDNNIIGSTRYNSGNVKYYLYNKDIQGSTTNILDENGDSSVGYTYDDFGTATVYSVKNNVHNEITYTGAVYDNSTGLYYINARYYDSRIGRFITQDTYRGEKDDAGTWHLYAYCANDPINYVDPSGHSAVALPWIYGPGSAAAAGALLSPVGMVVAGGVAVASVGYAGYKYYSSSKKKDKSKPKSKPIPNQTLNKWQKKILSNKDVEVDSKEAAHELVKKKFPKFKQEKAGHRSAEGWHWDKHKIKDSKRPVEHINIYSKKQKFRVHITWE